jgi:DnaA-homolog protein
VPKDRRHGARPRGCSPARYNSRVKQLVLDLIPAPEPTFDNFVAGANAEALTSSRGAAFQGNAVKIVYCWGVSGSGKTHLARAFAKAAPEAVVRDDAQQLNDDEQIALFNAINLALAPDSDQRVFVTGEVAPRDLPLRPELSSRLGSGLVFQLHPLTDDEKGAALRAHAAARGFALRDDVVQYLLRHGRRDMSSLVAFLDQLDQYSLETGREITLPLLREMSQPSLV